MDRLKGLPRFPLPVLTSEFLPPVPIVARLDPRAERVEFGHVETLEGPEQLGSPWQAAIEGREGGGWHVPMGGAVRTNPAASRTLDNQPRLSYA